MLTTTGSAETGSSVQPGGGEWLGLVWLTEAGGDHSARLLPAPAPTSLRLPRPDSQAGVLGQTCQGRAGTTQLLDVTQKPGFVL